MTPSTRTFLFLLLLAFLACLSYSNTFSVPFALDDLPRIALDPEIRRTWTYADLSNSRYVGFLTFALNYRFGGLDVFGYHLVNLLIHVVNGFLVYGLVKLLFKAARAPEDRDGSWIAFAAALLFLTHPLQTQAVTYIVQRFASLATLFYLLGVVTYLKWRLSPNRERRRFLWYGTALLATVLAMKTKETAFTLPLMILLMEAVFFRPLKARRWLSLAPFLAALAMIPFSRFDGLRTSEMAFQETVLRPDRADYLFTQFRVVVTYLRLLLFPVGQNLDYDYPIFRSFRDPPVFLSFSFLLGLLLLAVFLLRRPSWRPRLIAFGILWFFLALSSESSVIPIPDVIFEHRVYLPSVGFFLAAGSVLDRLRPKAVRFLLLGTIVSVLSAATYQRNRVWRDMATLWEDVVLKSPNKARGHYNLGWAYRDKNRLEDAAREYRTTLRLQPDLSEAHNNLGNVYKRQGRTEEAIREYQAALRLRPDNFRIHNNLGVSYASQGRLEEAIREFLAALRLHPDSVDAHRNLGIAYSSQGRHEEAAREFERAREARDKSK